MILLIPPPTLDRMHCTSSCVACTRTATISNIMNASAINLWSYVIQIVTNFRSFLYLKSHSHFAFDSCTYEPFHPCFKCIFQLISRFIEIRIFSLTGDRCRLFVDLTSVYIHFMLSTVHPIEMFPLNLFHFFDSLPCKYAENLQNIISFFNNAPSFIDHIGRWYPQIEAVVVVVAVAMKD